MPQRAGLAQVKRNRSLLPFVLPGPPLLSDSFVPAEDFSQENPVFLLKWMANGELKLLSKDLVWEQDLRGKQCETRDTGCAVKRVLRMRRRGSYDDTTAPIQPVSSSEGGNTQFIALILKLQIKNVMIPFF